MEKKKLVTFYQNIDNMLDFINTQTNNSDL